MSRHVVFVVFRHFQVLDLTGPMEVFALANRQPGRAGNYEIEVCSPAGGQVTASCGLTVATDPLPLRVADIDTLVVVGGSGTVEAAGDERLIRWLRTAAAESRRVTSVCSGAFLLAQAGLLAGRRATTHWSACKQLGQLFPDVSVESDPIFVRDGDVWTSAGVTAGMDLALALVEDDLGPEVVRAVARWLVLFVQRPGGQAQFSAQLATQAPARTSLRDLTAWMTDHLGDDLSVPALATRAAMSTRHFARAFRDEVGVTPGAYVESLRLEAAKRVLEATDVSVGAVSAACGFGTVETMHRSFKRSIGITPGDYRRHFKRGAQQCVS